MSSQLASQLQKLQHRPVDDKRLSGSFLFSDGDSRNFSREQIHQLAVHGLQTLIAVDNRFHFFVNRLFDPHGTRAERKQLRRDANQELNEAVEQFLTLLSPHIFLTAAHQVFEYLVRVHEVHVYNVSAVLRAFLPYHDHSLFSRVLLLLDLRDTGLEFLAANQETGSPLLREHLVQACAVSRKVLQLVCLTVAISVRMRVHNSAAHALFAGVAVQLASYPNAEATWRVLLPFVVEFITVGRSTEKLSNSELQEVNEGDESPWIGEDLDGSGVSRFSPSREAACSALVVLVAWSNEVKLSSATLRAVVKPIYHLLTTGVDGSASFTVSVVDLLAVLDVLFHTQREAVLDVTFSPQLKLMLSFPWGHWVRFIDSSEARICDTLVSVLLRDCLYRLKSTHSLQSVSSDVLVFVQCAVEFLPLNDALVAETIATLVSCNIEETATMANHQNGENEEEVHLGVKQLQSGRRGSKHGQSSTGRKCVTMWIQALERRFCHVFDTTLSQLLNDVTTQNAAARFLARHLSGARYELLEVRGSSGSTEQLPLFACLLHPVAEVRRFAAERMREMSIGQLTTSSLSTLDGSRGNERGNTLLDLLGHVAQYEQSPEVAMMFLEVAGAASNKLIRVILSSGAGAGETPSRSFSDETQGSGNPVDDAIAILRRLFRCFWTMTVTQGCVAIQERFYQLILLPLMQQVDEQRGVFLGGSKKKLKVPEMGDACRIGWGLLLYYATLLYVHAIDLLVRERSVNGGSAKERLCAGESTDAELTKLVMKLEKHLVETVPGIGRTATLFTPALYPGCDPLYEFADCDASTEGGKSAAAFMGGVTSLLDDEQGEEGFCLSVFECTPLLLALYHEASVQVRPTLERLLCLREANEDDRPSARAIMLECCVGCAALLSTAYDSELADVTHMLFQFFVSGRNGGVRTSKYSIGMRGGYLMNLQGSQRAAAGGMRGRVGRGAANDGSSPFLPKNLFTRIMGATIRISMEMRLTRNSEVGSCVEGEKMAFNSTNTLAYMGRLLGYLDAPLPAAAVSPMWLPPAYLHMLELCNAASDVAGDDWNVQLPVDWFRLVYRSVFESPVTLKSNCGSYFSLSGLFVAVTSPLAAPAGRREDVLTTLQGLILSAADDVKRSTRDAKKRQTITNMSSAQLFLEAALRQGSISITTLNALVEAIALEDSHAHLTHTASELLCRMIVDGVGNGGNEETTAPFSFLNLVVEHFYPLRARKSGIVVNALLPLLISLLEAGGDGGEGTVSPEAANFVQAICNRAQICAEMATLSNEDKNALLQLNLALVRHPFLRVSGRRTRLVYRHALSTFASVLSRGCDVSSANPLVFVPKPTRNTSQGTNNLLEKSDDEDYAKRVASVVSEVVLDDAVCLSRMGADALSLLVGTVGGYQRLFLPLVSQKLKQRSPDLSIIADALEAVAAASPSSPLPGSEGEGGDTVDAWEPPSWCTLHDPLKSTDVESILQLCAKSLSRADGGEEIVWRREGNTLPALRILCAIFESSHLIRFDGDDVGKREGEGGEDLGDSSLFNLVREVLNSFPLASLLPLLEDNDSADVGASGNSLYRFALSFVRCLVNLCLSSPGALNDGQPDGAAVIRQEVVRQSVILMAGLFTPDLPSSSGAQKPASASEAARPNSVFSGRTIGTVTELLRIVSPLFTPAVTPMHSNDFSIGGRVALHIPVVALLIRLESVNFESGKHNYTSAMEVCRHLLVSFDVQTQLLCLTGMMELLVDPHKQLSLSSPKVDGNRRGKVEGMDTGDVGCSENDDDYTMKRLFRKLLKPNQVVNRQEEIMYLINDTIKSEEFLAGFVALQHSTVVLCLDTAHADGGVQRDDTSGTKYGESSLFEGIDKSNECMALLVASLKLFAHYTELNTATENDAGTAAASQHSDGGFVGAPAYGETKAFVMLLELLAGNTLACVLAGINEPTFVLCMKNLLTDHRAAVQLKGLEMLLDRLHNALPTVEQILTKEEVERGRQKLRDPKSRLTLTDVVRLKARPFATKRSFTLFSHIFALMMSAARVQVGKAERVDNLRLLTLSVACMEELVRIIASGGSQHAEAALLNVNRTARVTEDRLNKLFGNHSRVKEVHRWVDSMVSVLPRVIRSCRNQDEEHTHGSKEDCLFAAAALLTALSTVSQVMGTAFTVPHSNVILQVVVDAAVFAAAGVPPTVSRGEVGSVLRQSSLNCLLRTFPSSWLMCQPYLSRIIYVATHLQNVDDTETNYLSVEVMSMLEVALEPQLFIEASAECVRGIVEQEVAADESGKRSKRVLRVRVDTHSLALLYSSIQRRVTSLGREELKHLSLFVGGTTARDNFWLSSMQTLASAPTLPSPDAVQPVLEAYTMFFLKFKAKHCTSFISTMAEWAFGGAAEGFVKSTEKQQAKESAGKESEDVRERDDVASVPRVIVHRWLLFYALCNHLLERLGSIMDFAFPVLLPYIVGTLASYCSSTTHAARHAADLIARTLEGALNSIRIIASAQTAPPHHDHSIPVDNYLATHEVFSAVMPAVVRQLTNLVYLADSTHDYAFRAEQCVIPAVRALFRSLTSSKQQSDTQREVLRSLRHPSRHVRRVALLCLDRIYEDGGGELAARLMAEMLPSVAELTEDRDDVVVEQARRLCGHLSSITGQDVLYAMGS
ncbi:hypothetical protein DPX39_090008100 [Trypanosoma brucei equiperdum]|uniref:HEAT repeat-containing protein 1 n=1 Tax=Trypanosoma brucei equiperdum TaxID=630700 RepID=A0A3L6L545_9TRYP|nr:hypothetical protein DPX39_090008100 [Trypanosoma brucei equiperdum]